MYNTKAEDLARIANDLDLLARKYGDGAEQLDQQMAGLDGATQQLISGGPEHWLGVSSEAFQAAWEERRARLQQISQILSQSAQHFTQFARTIEDNLPTIRADQAVMQESASHMLGVDDQASLLNEESQAQYAILTALAALNSQLEALAEEVKDCPQERESYGGPQDVNKSDSGGNEDKQGPTDSISPAHSGFFQLDWSNGEPRSTIDEIGQEYLDELKQEGVVIDDTVDTQQYLKMRGARGVTWNDNLPTDSNSGASRVTVLLGGDANNATVYEEYLHFQELKANNWVGPSPGSAEYYMEEIKVERQVLANATILKMTPGEQAELRRVLQGYIDELYKNYHIRV